MLNWFHEHLGFGGSTLIPFIGFILSVFWMAGIAGIADSIDSKSTKASPLLIFAILLPPVPIIWLIIDMIQQHRYLQRG